MKNILFLLLSVSLIMASSCTRNETDDFKAFFFRNDGADLFVEINGNIASNVFVLFLHGGPGNGSFGYNQGYFSDKMEEDYAMVYLDQRGNGASQGDDREALTIEQNSKDVYQLVQFLKAEYGEEVTVFLAGHSWGGLTSAHALIYTNLQEDINGWIEISGAHDFPKNDVEAVKMLQAFATDEISNGNNINFWESVLETVNEIDTLNITDKESIDLNSTGFRAEDQFELGSTETTSTRAPDSPNNPEFGLATSVSNSSVNTILNTDSENLALTDELYQIEIPCLFLWGKYDFVVPPALGISAHNLVNTTEKELVIFEKSGHSPMDNEGVLLVEEVKEFIELYR